MLTYNHYYFNTILKDYKIEDIILKNNIEIEKYLAVCKIQDLQFIILSRDIILESITTIIFML